jgi:arginyl-tRNA synthetase
MLGANPMQVAEKIAGRVQVPSLLIASIDLAKPGFINIVVAHDAYFEKIKDIATFSEDQAYGRCPGIGQARKVQVEFVSANPTGPLNVVSARAAAVGDALVKLLDRAGYDVKSEFYINDSGTQVELLGESLKARFREAIGEPGEIPEGGYPGGYLQEIARGVLQLAHGTDNLGQREQVAGFRPALEEEERCIQKFLHNITIPEERENQKGWFDDYLAFRKTLTPDHLHLWPSLYVCHLSHEGMRTSDMIHRLSLIEKFRVSLRGAQPPGPAEPKAEMVLSQEVFLGRAVSDVAFDFARVAVDEIVSLQRESLTRFSNLPYGGFRFDTWFKESSLKQATQEVFDALVSDGRFVVEKEGAFWLKGGGEGEEDEWVITRSTGQPTYFLSDIAYHVNKRKRGFEQVIDIWGPDHHGHVARMKTAMQVASQVIPGLDIAEDWLSILIAQQVNLIRDGKRVQMSKRAGEYVTLDDVVREIAPDPDEPRTGADVARFFFLMRRCNSHLDFDLDLAKKMSDENPVYYVQYAHARICSILEHAKESGYDEIPPPGAELSLLASDEELEVMKALAEFEDLVIGSALALEPHRIPIYLIDLAGKFHRFYHNHRVVTGDKAMSEARLYLCSAVRTVLRSAMSVIGISAPDSM